MTEDAGVTQNRTSKYQIVDLGNFLVGLPLPALPTPTIHSNNLQFSPYI
jgi:hypothetical protein